MNSSCVLFICVHAFFRLFLFFNWRPIFPQSARAVLCTNYLYKIYVGFPLCVIIHVWGACIELMHVVGVRQMSYHSHDCETCHMNLTKSYENNPREKGIFFLVFFFFLFVSFFFMDIYRWRNLALAGLCSLFFFIISFAFKRRGCLLNLEPSRQYHKRSCKCLNRGLLDFGVPTPYHKRTDSPSCLVVSLQATNVWRFSAHPVQRVAPLFYATSRGTS